MPPKNIERIFVSLFFIIFLLVGFLTYRDYGVSTDEMSLYRVSKIDYLRLRGALSETDFMYECKNNTSICTYPPLFEMVLYRLAPIGSSQSIFFTRHLATFLYFALGVFFFYLLGKEVFHDWRMGLIAALFLVISPRIFANAFYNSKDIPFLSAYIIAMYTMLRFLGRKNIFWAGMHGMATGIAASIRTPGIILATITFMAFLLEAIFSKTTWKQYLQKLIPFFVFISVALLIMYISFPYLYNDPIHRFIEVFNIMKQYPWNGYELYMGQNIGNHTPWHFTFVWFAISTPFIYLLFFTLGIFAMFRDFLKSVLSRNLTSFVNNSKLYLIALCGVLPILVTIAMKSVLYDGSRQMFFCYPSLLMVSLYGLAFLYNQISLKHHHKQILLALVMIIGLAQPIFFLVKYHPYGGVYFNVLAGSKMSVIKERFSLDSWALASKEGLEYVVKTDPRQEIKIAVRFYYENTSDTQPIRLGANKYSHLILPPADFERVTITEYAPDYVFDTYRYYPTQTYQKPLQKYYSVQVGDTDILTVYRGIPQ